jgi:hypothetical protein
VFPDHPKAVSYLGNFVGYSFAFNLYTDDQELIAQLDAAIAENMERWPPCEVAHHDQETERRAQRQRG